MDNPYRAPESSLVADVPEADLASRAARLGGSLIDGLIGLAATFPMFWLTGTWYRAMQGDLSTIDLIPLSLGGFGVYLAIHGYTLATRGQTLGKLVARTQIVSAADGRLLPLWRVLALRVMPP